MKIRPYQRLTDFCSGFLALYKMAGGVAGPRICVEMHRNPNHFLDDLRMFLEYHKTFI